MWQQIQEHKSLHVTFAYTREVLLHVATWALTNRRIDTSKWHDTSPLTTFANKSEGTLPNDILAQGRGDYRLQLSVIFSSVVAFISHWDVHVMTLRELTGYTWKSRRVTCSLPWTMLCTATEQRTRSVSSGLSKQLGHMPRIRSKQSIHQMGRFAHLSVTLLTQYFSLPLSPVRSDPSKEAVTNDQSRKRNLFDFFCLPSIVVGYPSVRRRELALRSIILKFKINASSLLVMGYLAS